MRAVLTDGTGHRNRVDLPTWVKVHAESFVLVVVSCERCGSDTRIDVHCGSSERLAEQQIGQFAKRHSSCQSRVRVNSRRWR